MTSPVAGLTPDMWFYWLVGYATRYSDDEAARRAEEHVPTIIGTAVGMNPQLQTDGSAFNRAALVTERVFGPVEVTRPPSSAQGTRQRRVCRFDPDGSFHAGNQSSPSRPNPAQAGNESGSTEGRAPKVVR